MKDIILQSKTRIKSALALTAALGAILLLQYIIEGSFIIWLTLGVVYVIAFHEAYKLFKVKKTFILPLGIFCWILGYIVTNPVVAMLFAPMVLMSFMLKNEDIELEALMPFFYPSIPIAVLYTQVLDFGISSLIWLIAITASCDIGAYFVGKSIGTKKFSSISPNKTKEGILGGIACAVIVGLFIGPLLDYSIASSIIISFVVAVAGIYGDLYESFLKRRAQVKDSGNLIPGHGGILDRIDSYLFGTIAMIVLMWFFK